LRAEPTAEHPTTSAVGRSGILHSRAVQASAVVLALVLLSAIPALGHAFPAGPGQWIIARLDELYDWVVANRNTSPIFLYGFNYVSLLLGGAVAGIHAFLEALTWAGVVVLLGFVSWRVAGRRVVLVVLAAFAVFGLTGLWDEAMVTLALIAAAVLLALAVGLPLGVVAGLSPRFRRLIEPVLSFLQIMPAFAYLMPMLLLFGIGNTAAAVATMVYAFPPAVRITALALRGVDAGAVEAARSLGSTGVQLLVKVRLPLAKRTILLGVNQTIMLAVSMVVLASVGLLGLAGLRTTVAPPDTPEEAPVRKAGADHAYAGVVKLFKVRKDPCYV
jgi:glycine betaine/proline transport system permease protein